MKEIKLEKEEVHTKERLLGLFVIIFYIFSSIMEAFIAKMNHNLYYPSLVIGSLIMMICAYLCFRKRINRDVKALWQNKRKYVVFILQNQLIMYGIYYIACFITAGVLGDNAQSINQMEIEKLPIMYIAFTALLYAPFVEEIVFRGSLRRILRSDLIFIVASGLIFGLLHTASEATLFEIIVKGLPYITIGTYYAYLYLKSENITVTMISHFIQNLLGVLALIAFK